jgi:hypothetical protein
MKRILVPSRDIADWPSPVGSGGTEGDARAAELLAHSWQAAGGFPPIVQELFSQSGVAALETAEVLLAVPGWEVVLPGGGPPRASGLMVLAACEVDEQPELLVVLVEGHAYDVGDQTVGERETACRPSEGRRLAAVLDLLDLCYAPPQALDDVPCGLLEHVAATVITAREFTARHALALDHSFGAASGAETHLAHLVDLMSSAAQSGDTTTGPIGLRPGSDTRPAVANDRLAGPVELVGVSTYLARLNDLG